MLNEVKQGAGCRQLTSRSRPRIVNKDETAARFMHMGSTCRTDSPRWSRANKEARYDVGSTFWSNIVCMHCQADGASQLTRYPIWFAFTTIVVITFEGYGIVHRIALSFCLFWGGGGGEVQSSLSDKKTPQKV